MKNTKDQERRQQPWQQSSQWVTSSLLLMVIPLSKSWKGRWKSDICGDDGGGGIRSWFLPCLVICGSCLTNDPLLQRSFQPSGPRVGVCSQNLSPGFLSQLLPLGFECAWLVPGSWQVVPPLRAQTWLWNITSTILASAVTAEASGNTWLIAGGTPPPAPQCSHLCSGLFVALGSSSICLSR